MKIFVSYRRADSEETTGRIFDRLAGEFGREAVFRDIDTIPLKTKFADYILRWLKDTTVLVAVIGPDWLEISDSSGRRRLDDPNDYVRIELLTALGLGIPIIPIVVRRANFPARNELPTELQGLSDWNGWPVRPDPDFNTDITKLINQIKSFSDGNSFQKVTPPNSERPDDGLNTDQVKLLLELYVKQHRMSVRENGYEYRCVRTGPIGQCWGHEYKPYYIDITRNEEHPKRNLPDDRVNRLRWLGAFEELDRRGYLNNVAEDIYELSDVGRKIGYTLMIWMQQHDPENVPKVGYFD